MLFHRDSISVWDDDEVLEVNGDDATGSYP